MHTFNGDNLTLHAIQSFPVSCLNRDDLGMPKTAVYGGVNRGRISSQCAKYSQRAYCKDSNSGGIFEGQRTRKLRDLLTESLIVHGMKNPEKTVDIFIAATIGKGNDVMSFITQKEIDLFAEAIVNSNINDAKDVKKMLKDINRTVIFDNAMDIIFFGRFWANEPSLRIDGAIQVSHALTTHKIAAPETDYFSAVDDLMGENEAGAGMLGDIYFNTGVYYRWSNINLNALSNIPEDLRREAVASYIDAFISAVPVARQNSMASMTHPAFVLGTRTRGYRAWMSDAFDSPTQPEKNGGILLPSIKCLFDDYTLQKKNFLSPHLVREAAIISTNISLDIKAMNSRDFCKDMARDA